MMNWSDPQKSTKIVKKRREVDKDEEEFSLLTIPYGDPGGESKDGEEL